MFNNRGNQNFRRGRGRGRAPRRGRGRGRGRNNDNYNNRNDNNSQETPSRRSNKRARQDFSPGGNQTTVVTLSSTQMANLNNSILQAGVQQSSSAITTANRTARRIPIELCIGNYKVYIKNLAHMEVIRNKVKPPKRVQYIPATTNQFINNKVEVDKFRVRSLIYFPDILWYLTSQDISKYEDNELLDDDETTRFQYVKTLILKIEKDFKTLNSLYAPVSRYVICEGPSFYTAALKYVADLENYVTIDISPLGHTPYNQIENDAEKFNWFSERLRTHLKFHHQDGPEPEPEISPEGVYDPFGDN